MKRLLKAVLLAALLAFHINPAFATTWYPIAYSAPQFEDANGNPYSGAVLKAYDDGTSTPISMATDNTGATTASSFTLNSSGYPISGGNVIIPHVSQDFKLALYPTQTAADANTGAIWTVDSIRITQSSAGERLVAFATDTGAADAYVIAPSPAITAYTSGQLVTLVPTNTNTGASTINVNGLGTKNIKNRDGKNPPAGAMLSGGAYGLLYNGTNFILMNPQQRAATRQYLTSGTGATYTLPTGAKAILVRAWGGGGGGGALTTNSGAAGGDTTFNSVVAKGGSGGTRGDAGGNAGAGGTAGTGTATKRWDGESGSAGGVNNSSISGPGGRGGGTALGGAGAGAPAGGAAGSNAGANTGAGGGGASAATNQKGAGGGGAGEYYELYISSPSATYTYTIGTAGAGGSAGTFAGGNGGTGMIIVEEYY